MSEPDVMWHEDDGGDRDARNFLSFPTEGKFCKATKNVLPWAQSDKSSAGRSIYR